MVSISWRTPVPDKATVRLTLGAVVAVAVFLGLSWSDGHYWDEYFYLYSVFAHSPAELVRFEVQSAIFPVGFFSEKIGHVALLDLLTTVFGASPQVLYAIQAVYALLLLGFFGAAYGLLRDLLGEQRARDSSLVLMFSPLALYLSFKVMSEVPGLLFATLGGWAFVGAFRSDSRRRTGIRLMLAAVALAIAMLFRVTMIVSFAGLGLALMIAGDQRFERRRLVFRGLIVGIAAVILHTGGLALAGGSLLRFGPHIASVVRIHPPLQRVYALALFLQTLVLVVPFAWRHRSETGPRLASVWLAASALPFLAGHEPRYYAPALVPLAVLAAAGLRGVGSFLFGTRFPYGWVGLLAVLALVNRGLLVPLMPYEVDQARLLGLFRTVQARAPGATYLIPWTADYSLLRFSFPAARIELCLSNIPAGRHFQPGHEGPITQPDRWWAGADHYVGSRPALVRQPHPWYFVGWTFNPAAIRLQQLLGRLSLGPLMQKGPRLHNHLAGSWIWHDRSLTLRPTDHMGRYYVYEVSQRSHAARELAVISPWGLRAAGEFESKNRSAGPDGHW
jgi:Dolichyl-phosphate-mannose-protein mannosyltransferase